MKRNITRFSTKIISGVAKKLAERDANTTCPFYTYQPKLSHTVKKLKKS